MCLLKTDLSILADAGSVIAIGFTVVFLVLLLLTAIFKIFGVAMSNTREESAPVAVPVPKAAPAPVAQVAPIVGNTETVSSKPDVDGGIPAETVAVISAAVASVAPAGSQYAVKGIRKM
ncbi:MAG: OadG family protein [Clostridia bacterium]|nr:OadG family protein [Clostridia bacterium]